MLSLFRQLFINKPLLLQIPKGAISGQQLADAARTLVLNCLPVKTAGIGCGDQNAHLPPCSASTILEFPVHQSNEHVHELPRIVPPCEPDLPNNSLTSIVITASPRAKSSPHTARKYKEVSDMCFLIFFCSFLMFSLFILSLNTF